MVGRINLRRSTKKKKPSLANWRRYSMLELKCGDLRKCWSRGCEEQGGRRIATGCIHRDDMLFHCRQFREQNLPRNNRAEESFCTPSNKVDYWGRCPIKMVSNYRLKEGKQLQLGNCRCRHDCSMGRRGKGEVSLRHEGHFWSHYTYKLRAADWIMPGLGKQPMGVNSQITTPFYDRSCNGQRWPWLKL